MTDDDAPRLINGMISFPCVERCGRWVPYTHGDTCADCETAASEWRINHPSQWAPDGPLSRLHDAARRMETQ